MRAVLSVCLIVTFAVVSGSSPTSAQDLCPGEPALFHPCAVARAKVFDPPRTREGEPDLQGFWRGLGHGTENIEEHPEAPADNGGPSLIVDPPDGKIPYQSWAAALSRENQERYVDPNIPCFPSGVPRSMYTPGPMQIRQSPGYVAILFERAHNYRLIPTDGRPHVAETIRLWQGDSRGRWEGNTLVVDVTNQNARPWFDQAGNVFTDGAHVVERFTLVDSDTIHYQATIDDPNVYTRPWTMAFPIRRNTAPGFQLLEHACHEGERNTQPLIDAGYQIYPGAPSRPDGSER